MRLKCGGNKALNQSYFHHDSHLVTLGKVYFPRLHDCVVLHINWFPRTPLI